MKARVTVVGTGYVGLSIAVLLARSEDVVALDIDASRVAALRAGQSPIEDGDIERLLSEGGLRLTVTTDPQEAYAAAEFVVVATPTTTRSRTTSTPPPSSRWSRTSPPTTRRPQSS